MTWIPGQQTQADPNTVEEDRRQMLEQQEEEELHLFALIINYKVLSSTQQELPEATPKANAFTVPPVAAPELLHQQYCHLSSLSVFHLGSSRRVIPRA